MKYKILLIVFSICLIISAILSSVSISSICGIDQNNGCNIVNNSKYGQIFGISNSILGVIAFTIMVLLTMFHMRKKSDLARKLIIAGTSIIGIFALYFLYIQIFVINAMCKYCIVVDVFSLVAMAFVFFYAE